jgi:hypothetical protein
MDMTSYFLGKIANENSGGGGVSVQADYNQNNPDAADYIKNRPFYSHVEEDIIFIPQTEELTNVKGALGIIIGEEYEIYTSEPQEGDSPVLRLQAEEFEVEVSENATQVVPILVYPDIDNPVALLLDTINISLSTGGPEVKNGFVLQSTMDFFLKGKFNKFEIISPVYLPTNIGGTMEIATEYTPGSVSPVTKTAEMSQAVGVDSQGRLYTLPLLNATTARLGGVRSIADYNSTTFPLRCAISGDGYIYAEKPPLISQIKSNSSDTEIPSAKATYDFTIQAIEQALETALKEASY